jgi:hypothetical protein
MGFNNQELTFFEHQSLELRPILLILWMRSVESIRSAAPHFQSQNCYRISIEDQTKQRNSQK